MRRRFGIVLLFAVLCPACAPPAQLGGEPGAASAADSSIVIRVINHSQLDATIYIAHDGARDRLGTVTAAAAASFPVRTRILGAGDFTLVADPLGSLTTASSERLLVSLGSLFIWTLESDFAHNSVQVRE